MCESRPVSFLLTAIYQLLKRKQTTLAGLLILSAQACADEDNRLDDKILIGVVHADGSESACAYKRCDFFVAVCKVTDKKIQRSSCRNCLRSLWNSPDILAKKCAKCLVVYYCDSQCQRADWPSHRTECCQNITHDFIVNQFIDMNWTPSACEAKMAIPKGGHFGCFNRSADIKEYSFDEIINHVDQCPLICMCDLSGMTCMVDISLDESILAKGL